MPVEQPDEETDGLQETRERSSAHLGQRRCWIHPFTWAKHNSGRED